MKIAITGGSGFLGNEVCSLLVMKGYTPIIIGRQHLFDKTKFEYRETDYSIVSLNKVLKDIDSVIHLASVRGVNGSIADFHQNEIITENLYVSCSNLGITNIVYSSSIAVYSDISNIPWKEDQITLPKTLYGISKISCEYLGAIYNRVQRMNIKSLRIAQILGEGERKGHMMNTFIDNAFENKTIKVIGKSIARREFVYVKDVTRAIMLAILRPELSGVFNIGSGKAYTNLEIALEVNRVFDNCGNLEYIDSIDEGIESSLMDSSRSGDVLGYYPEYSLDNSLNDIKKIKLVGV